MSRKVTGNIRDLKGQVFGRLKVIELDDKTNKKLSAFWKCECECGNTIIVNSNSLTRNLTKSCGCLHSETAKKLGKKTGAINAPKAYEKFKKFNIEDTNIKRLNCNKYKCNKTGNVGVFWREDRKRWTAYITINKKRVYLGNYIELEDAIKARKLAEEKYFKPIIDKFNEQNK